MIHIDFQGGAHGNYLEFVCNKIAGIVIQDLLPFNLLGAAHNKLYHSSRVFFAWHYSYAPNIRYPKLYNKIISIQIESDDLLPLSQVSLLRAGDYGYDNDLLEVNTYNKLNNVDYQWVLENLIDGFFTDQIRKSYDAVKDPSWPTVNNMNDFNHLPCHIRTECIQQHGLVLLELSADRPDCPRFILREFFKIGFQHPDQHGFITRQKKAIYGPNDDVYVFPFKCFYNKSRFLKEVEKVAEWAGILYTCQNEINQLHDEFLSRQPYKDSKRKCDKLVQAMKNHEPVDLHNLTLLEEAYINAALGWDYFQ